MGVLNLEPMNVGMAIQWSLPPSKSHMIRWLALASQSSGSISIRFSELPGADVSSMADCLEEMGTSIDRRDGEWVVSGVGDEGLQVPSHPLNCGNSGTASRFLMAMATGVEEEVIIDGDDSLRARDMSVLAAALRDLGGSVSDDRLPILVKGPIKTDSTSIDLSHSSQPLSAILLSSPSFPFPVKLQTYGRGVSRVYSQMSFEIARMCGSENVFSSGTMRVLPWKVDLPDTIAIPPEDSLLPIAMLISKLHESDLHVSNEPSLSPVMLSLENGSTLLDLRDESDLICPASALMAIGNGGRIVGATHAKGKESDRIETTLHMLEAFGMDANATEEGLEIPGNQTPSRPSHPIETHQDHRLAMTAMALASRFGGSVRNAEISSVSDPGFITRLLDLGA